MDGIGIKDVIYIVGLAVSVVSTFFITKHQIKEFIRDKVEELNKKITELEKEQINLKHRDEIQQQVIDEFRKQVLDHLPKLFSIIENSKSNSK